MVPHIRKIMEDSGAMSLPSPFRMKVRSGEIAVNVPARDALMSELRARFAERRGFALATVNLDHIVKLRSVDAFRDAYQAHDYVVADGNPIVWLSRLARTPVELIPGSDLVRPLAALAAETGVKVALVGSTAAVLARAAERLEAENPGIRIVATLAPRQGFDPEGAEADGILDTLRQSGAGLTMIALGAPKQELFAARGRRALPSMGFASVGASLDFIAGEQIRAPRWVRRIAMEWAWRLALSPNRLARRYLHCALVFPKLALSALASRAGGDDRKPV